MANDANDANDEPQDDDFADEEIDDDEDWEDEESGEGAEDDDEDIDDEIEDDDDPEPIPIHEHDHAHTAAAAAAGEELATPPPRLTVSPELKTNVEEEKEEEPPAKVTNGKFTKEDLDQMLYEGDESAFPVVEYHPPGDEHGHNSRPAKGEAPKLTFLELDTSEQVYVVEFYSPWCPHCKKYKPHYIEVAKEVMRRSLGTPKITFYAVSCEFHHALCKSYRLKGYPTVMGFPLHSSIAKYGVELNPDGGEPLTAASVAKALGFALAHEAKSFVTSSYSKSDDQKAHLERIRLAAQEKASRKKEWHEAPSTINDRYHNAAVSLAYALKTAVYMENGPLEHRRALALWDFVQLLDWTTPQSWDVRTHLVKNLIKKFHLVTVGQEEALVSLVEEHQFHYRGPGDVHTWGHIYKVDPKHRQRSHGLGVDVPVHHGHNSGVPTKEELMLENKRWTAACTHDLPAMGFTCGLWDLMHMTTIGASLPQHQLYAHHMGYMTSQKYVSQVLRDFIFHFLGCDVCRQNFLDMYDNCGHDHCHRLTDDLPVVVGVLQMKEDPPDHHHHHKKPNHESGAISDPKTREALTDLVDAVEESSRDLAMWLWEVHNAVNVRLMREAAEEESRIVSHEELLAGRWPTVDQCPKCWLDANMTQWNSNAVYSFLRKWYWPGHDKADKKFQRVLKRRVRITTGDAGEDFLAKMTEISGHHHHHHHHHGHGRSMTNGDGHPVFVELPYLPLMVLGLFAAAGWFARLVIANDPDTQRRKRV